MDNVADRLMVVKGDGLVRLFEGSYGEYLEMLAEEKQEEEEILRQLELQDVRKQQAAQANSSSTTGKASSSSSGSSKKQGSSSSSSGGGSSKAGAAVVEAPTSPKKTATAHKPGRKLSWAEQQEYQKLCKRMEELEKQRNSLNEKIVVLAQSGSDLGELERCSLELGKCSDEEDSLSERWLELAELAGDL
ncbi:hypothetical protein DUNSADRAFT_369 [Dunaliella salina]|uniref:ABC transporter Uup C-terminal domain-containing protein n=1 Tax=Dunaliella salina TaxID=3046 RepID=A0ABQ7FZ32_DUNSA|nr:hypothetical protein DUNSADRAFT_369 [Dunaliella salina]|eukprot:KAF5827602.1 hypothetical protein DUNSADRAFT_369 [Dunaliella salina]